MKPSCLSRSSLILIFLLTPGFSACTKSPPQPASSTTDPQALLVSSGHKAYVAHCIACHNIDPRKDGSIGPAVWGSTRELLELKVLKGEYPAGYTPKRPTQAMAPLPFVKDKIEAIHAFLNGN